jgi:uncharacterized protein YbjT (DUF2867 family)
MKVVITGSSGMVGQGVLLECLDNDEVSEVLVVNRKSIGLKNPKIKEVLVNNFFKLDDIKQNLKGFDACFFCIGTSAIGKNEADYSKLTFDLTINFAKAFLEQSQNSVFCYVTGAGTDSTGKGRTMWARVKGKTENTLLNMPFKSAYMFRPGYIQPLKGVKSRTNWYSFIYKLFSPIYLILKHFPTTATNTINIGKAMIKVAEGNYSTKILGNKEINELAKE